MQDYFMTLLGGLAITLQLTALSLLLGVLMAAAMTWVLDQRIQRAQHLLSSSQLPISHISQECGFADQSHFCRTFSKWVGAAPNAWRRLNASSAASAFAHCGVTRTGNTARDKVR